MTTPTTAMTEVAIGGLTVGNDRPLMVIAGPCQLESAGHAQMIAGRMAARTGHYMPPSLLDSQFAALEPPGPDEAIAIDIDQPLDAIVSEAAAGLDR